MNLTRLEKAVLEMMLEKHLEHRETIKQQIEAAEIARRQFSSVGFFSYFTVPETIRHDLPDMELNGVGASFPHLKNGAGFILFVREGVVKMLEGYTYDESWPDNADGFALCEI